MAPYLALCREHSEQREYNLRTVCGTSCAQVDSGVTCPMTFLRGRLSINRLNVGFEPDVSRPWSRICACYCASSWDARHSLRR